MLSSQEPVEQELVFPARLQGICGGLPLVCSHQHCPGLPVCVPVLDQEGVKGALGHHPHKAQGVWGLICPCELP